MADTTHVKGLAELQKFLDTVPVKLERNVMRGAMRAGMNVVRPVAQSSIHSVSGLLAKGLKVSTSARGGVVTSKLKATGPHAHIAHWIEYGVAAHIIEARRNQATGRFVGALAFPGAIVTKVQHPGFKGTGFMRNALDRQAQPALIATGEYVKRRLSKEGLDVAHIAVEGDE